MFIVSGNFAIASAQQSESESNDTATLYQQLKEPGYYARHKALKELIIVAPKDTKTRDALLHIFYSDYDGDNRNRKFLAEVAQALIKTSREALWTNDQVELLTSILVHHDAYDLLATDQIAATILGIAGNQDFSYKAIYDLTTVLWHRVDKSPNRTRSANHRDSLARALRQINLRQGLSIEVINALVKFYPVEKSNRLRRESLLILTDYIKTHVVPETFFSFFIQVLQSSPDKYQRILAIRALKMIAQQPEYRQKSGKAFQHAYVKDTEATVRTEALKSLSSIADYQAGIMPVQEINTAILHALNHDTDASVRLQAIDALGKNYSEKTLPQETLESLLARLSLESNNKVRSQIALVLWSDHKKKKLPQSFSMQLIPFSTEVTSENLRKNINNILLDNSKSYNFLQWIRTQHNDIWLTDLNVRNSLMSLRAANELQQKLLQHYVLVLSTEQSDKVKQEILQGIFILAQTIKLPESSGKILIEIVRTDKNKDLRFQSAALLLNYYPKNSAIQNAFYILLNDENSLLANYAAYGLSSMMSLEDELISVLWAAIADKANHNRLRWYALHRLSVWQRKGLKITDTQQIIVLDVTREEANLELKHEAWSLLSQLEVPEQEWYRATRSDDLAIQRLAWNELQERGVNKPLIRKLSDPKQRQEIFFISLLGVTILTLFISMIIFFVQLLRWFSVSERKQWGRMLVTQLLVGLSTLAVIAVEGIILFALALSHSGSPSIKDYQQLNMLFFCILMLYLLIIFFSWKLLPEKVSSKPGVINAQ